jgi:hypothetical protein
VNAIKGFEGPLIVTRHALESGTATAAAAAAAAAAAGPADSGSTASGVGSPVVLSVDEQQQQRSSSTCSLPSNSTSTGTSPAIPYTHPQQMLQHLDVRETLVQSVLQQLGGCGAAYSELYTSQLLQKAMADPSRAAELLGMTKAERMAYTSEVRAGVVFGSSVCVCVRACGGGGVVCARPPGYDQGRPHVNEVRCRVVYLLGGGVMLLRGEEGDVVFVGGGEDVVQLVRRGMEKSRGGDM